MAKWFLKCDRNTHDPILLPNNEPVFIGRGPLTRIKDTRCSRQQLELTADYICGHVSVRQLGTNQSGVNGVGLHKESIKLLKQGDKLEVLLGNYMHSVHCENHKTDILSKYEIQKPGPDQTEKRMYPQQNELQKSQDIASINEKKRSRILDGEKNYSKKGHWSMGLLASMDDPNLQVEADDQVVIIKDKYPKAKYHYLILPKEKIPNLKALKRNHIQLLKHMQRKGWKIAEKHKDHVFRFGYHAVPSMAHLHLHVISQDFSSHALKTKKHWNSFNTDYFLDSKDVIQMLEDQESVSAPTAEEGKSMLNAPLKCHKCSFVSTNMPRLKEHILKH